MPQTGGVNTPVGPAGVDEAGLVERARSGDGHAFASLYDRYERSVFNLCYRLTGSGDDAADATQEAFVAILERLPSLADRDLNFPAYVLTCARHASYRAIESRRRTEPAGGASSFERDPDPRDPGFLDEDPVRAALLSDQRHEVRRANATLPERQREVLALRELEQLSYDEIAEIMEMNRNSVAQLIFRARIALRDALHARAAASIPPADDDCARAMPLMAMREDGELDSDAEARWLEAHLGRCLACRVRREAAAEAGASYRAWAPIAPLLVLRDATIARAAEHLGADWSAVATAGRPDSSDGLDLAGSAPAGERSSGDRHSRHTGPGRSLVAPLVAGVALFLALLALLLPGQLGDTSGGDPQVPARSLRSLEPLLEAAKADRQARRERGEEDAAGPSTGAVAGTTQGGSTGAATGTGQTQAGAASADASEEQGGADSALPEDANEKPQNPEEACAPEQCPP